MVLKHNPLKSENNNTQEILEVMSIGIEMKSNSILYQVSVHRTGFRIILRSLEEIGAVRLTKYAHYIITDFGREILRRIKNGKS
jgi:predicted transcriptional regulator